MTDVVHYALPLGFLGRIMNALIVKNKLKEIFDYQGKRYMLGKLIFFTILEINE